MPQDQPDTPPKHGLRPEREKLPLGFVAVALLVMAGALYGAITLVDRPNPQPAPEAAAQ